MKYVDYLHGWQINSLFGGATFKSSVGFYSNSAHMTESKANQLITNNNPGTHSGSGRKKKEVILTVLVTKFMKRLSDGTKATKQQLVSILASAPESILITELVKTFIDNFYDE